MQYPKEFVDAVKAEYPDMEVLHTALDRGSDIVARYLDELRSEDLKPEVIVKMINEGRVAELKAEAEKRIRRTRLYGQAAEIWQAQLTS